MNSDNVIQMSLEDILTKLASDKWADPIGVALHEILWSGSRTLHARFGTGMERVTWKGENILELCCLTLHTCEISRTNCRVKNG